MAKDKEIEIKWDAAKVERSAFNRAIKRHIRGRNWRKVVVAGFDYYYENPCGYVARHRHGSQTNELTVKARMSKKSTTIRREINLSLAKEVSPITMQKFMAELGFPKVLPIFKDCDIYFIQYGKLIVDVVWYAVKVDGKPNKVYIEVEIHEAPVRVSLAMLKKWKKFLFDNFGLLDSDIVHESLYEINSGKRYRMSRSK